MRRERQAARRRGGIVERCPTTARTRRWLDDGRQAPARPRDRCATSPSCTAPTCRPRSSSTTPTRARCTPRSRAEAAGRARFDVTEIDWEALPAGGSLPGHHDPHARVRASARRRRGEAGNARCPSATMSWRSSTSRAPSSSRTSCSSTCWVGPARCPGPRVRHDLADSRSRCAATCVPSVATAASSSAPSCVATRASRSPRSSGSSSGGFGDTMCVGALPEALERDQRSTAPPVTAPSWSPGRSDLSSTPFAPLLRRGRRRAHARARRRAHRLPRRPAARRRGARRLAASVRASSTVSTSASPTATATATPTCVWLQLARATRTRSTPTSSCTGTRRQKTLERIDWKRGAPIPHPATPRRGQPRARTERACSTPRARSDGTWHSTSTVHRELEQRAVGRPRLRRVRANTRCPTQRCAPCATCATSSTTPSATCAICSSRPRTRSPTSAPS